MSQKCRVPTPNTQVRSTGRFTTGSFHSNNFLARIRVESQITRFADLNVQRRIFTLQDSFYGGNMSRIE